MKIIIDTEAQTLVKEDESKVTLDLYSDEAFELLSDYWVKVGWNQKYQYSFSWFGRPVIQLPEDMIRMQEIIYRIKPDVIVETGVAHGGSLIYYASLVKAMGIESKVIGVDIEIRPHNRKAIEEHELFSYITLIEGSSIDDEVIGKVYSQVLPNQKVLVILDSCHTKEHVLAELHAYHNLVSVDSYIVATDGVMKDLYDTPRGDASWEENHPTAAAYEFVKLNSDFIIEQPKWPFNESQLQCNVTHWPGAWIKRIK